jgi:hypothetical protein
MPSEKRPLREDVERLSRGAPTRQRIGSRGIPHRLTQRERILFEVAKKNGFLKIPASGVRQNVIHIYRLWCEASKLPCDIRHVTTREPS